MARILSRGASFSPMPASHSAPPVARRSALGLDPGQGALRALRDRARASAACPSARSSRRMRRRPARSNSDQTRPGYWKRLQTQGVWCPLAGRSESQSPRSEHRGAPARPRARQSAPEAAARHDNRAAAARHADRAAAAPSDRLGTAPQVRRAQRGCSSRRVNGNDSVKTDKLGEVVFCSHIYRRWGLGFRV